MTSFLPRVKAVLSRSNLPFKYKNATPGDGNCFFHAIIDQLQRQDMQGTISHNILHYCHNHTTLRKAVVSFIRTDIELKSSENFNNLKLVAMEEYGSSSFESYLTSMSQDGTWADTLTIYSTSIFLKKDISLAVDSRPGADPWQTFSGGGTCSGAPPVITLVYLHNIHFQSIHPLEMSNICRHCAKPKDQMNCSPDCTLYNKCVSEKTSKPPGYLQETVVCVGCNKSFKSINMHLSRSDHCRLRHGFSSKEDFFSFNKKEKTKRYRLKNSETLRRKHEVYNQEKQSSICSKQKKYNIENAEKIKQKQDEYNSKRADQIKQKQSNYNCKNADQIKQKQSEYNCKNADQIKQKQKEYNCKNADQIKQKQSEYNCKNADQIKQKQSEYNCKNADQIKQKQSEYNCKNADQIKQKQSEYNKLHKKDINRQQAIYDKENKLQKRLSQANYDFVHKDKKKQKQACYNAANKEVIAIKQAFRRLETFDCTGVKERYIKFKKSIQNGLNYICICCNRIFFLDQVVCKGSHEKLKESLNDICFGLYSSTIRESTQQTCYLCHTCNKYLFKKTTMPPLCYFNGLQLDKIPDCLKLNELESTLIAKNIIFLKLFQLPVSRWSAIKDNVVNVPVTDNDLEKTLSSISSLPRDPNDAGLIAVQLKRKISFKNVVTESFVNPKKLIAALELLKNVGHPGYKKINIEKEYNFHFQCNKKQKSDSESSSDEDIFKDPMRKDHLEEGSTIMMDDNPEMRLILNQSKNTLNKKQTLNSAVSCPIAPGEGKIPINLLRDNNWDINAFPQLFPTGRFGFYQQRPIKISALQYFIQRLQNCDKRFSSYTPFVFSALYFIERQQLEQKINVSFKKGTVTHGNFMAIEDGFSVFDKIPGTPRYWQQKRYEMIARLEQLGPFQIFFTLSMADKRWEENFVSILAQRGCKITYIPAKNTKLSYQSDSVLINDIPIDTFLANEDRHTLLRDNVLTLTRNFDHRVKSFIRHIVRGPNNPMKVTYYTYRVEFQVRGAAHVHGVLWLNLDALNKTFPNIKNTLVRLYHNENVHDEGKKVAADFIDSFVSVSSISSIKELVQDVQRHNHTKTCRKGGKKFCRFGFPRFPSKKTLIAQPIKLENFSSREECVQKLRFYTSLLDKVKQELETIFAAKEEVESMTILELLQRANVDEKDYYDALSSTLRGTKIVLKRNVKDVFINNYNEEWLRAWNGNMDLQICLDSFAIATYITDYYTKDESGTTKVLKEAAKQDFSNIKDKMKCLAQVFLTHRQIGMCEAFYRILPSLHLSQSNVKCVFVHTGFPSNRSRFLQRVPSKKDPHQQGSSDSSDEEMDTS